MHRASDSAATLLLDIGNSRLKWRLHRQGGAPPQTTAIAHGGDPVAAITAMATGWQGPQPTAIAVAQVLGESRDADIGEAIEQHFRQRPRFARSTALSGGLVNGYAEPQRLGVDRWLAMLAMWLEHRGAFMVASAGTALTVDAVDAVGRHLGGVIAPGLASAIDATLGSTRFATRGIDHAFQAGLGVDTETCVRQGALHATAGALDRLGARYEGVKVISGGDAPTLLPHLVPIWQHKDHLVLEGLAAWAALPGP